MIPEITKVLYATDLSKNSSYAFLYATDVARRHNAKIVILHAIEPIPVYVEAEAGITDQKKREQQDEAIEDIKKLLVSFCQKAETQIGSP